MQGLPATQPVLRQNLVGCREMRQMAAFATCTYYTSIFLMPPLQPLHASGACMSTLCAPVGQASLGTHPAQPSAGRWGQIQCAVLVQPVTGQWQPPQAQWQYYTSSVEAVPGGRRCECSRHHRHWVVPNMLEARLPAALNSSQVEARAPRPAWQAAHERRHTHTELLSVENQLLSFKTQLCPAG
jgi:hypothetical protein